MSASSANSGVDPDQATTTGAGATAAARSDAEHDALGRLRSDVARALGRPAAEVGDHDDLLELGLDSIRLMSLLQTWSRPGSELDLVDFVDDPRLVSWAARIRAARSRS